MKKVYFISGFPRAGNTLLSSILNQNPNISATGKSFLPDMFYILKDFQNNDDVYKNCINEMGMNNVYKHIFRNFFENIPADYIVDRGEWITPFNYSILKQYCPNEVKIVILVRDILDIIKSFLKICEQYPDFIYNKKYNSLDKTISYQSEIEEKADIIMSKDSYMDYSLGGIKWLQDNNLLKDCLLVEYNDLIGNTKQELKNIYEYLNIPIFNHNLTKLNQIGGYDDTVLGAPIHKIRTDKIVKEKNNIVLTKNIINKYGHLNIWRK